MELCITLADFAGIFGFTADGGGMVINVILWALIFNVILGIGSHGISLIAQKYRIEDSVFGKISWSKFHRMKPFMDAHVDRAFRESARNLFKEP